MIVNSLTSLAPLFAIILTSISLGQQLTDSLPRETIFSLSVDDPDSLLSSFQKTALLRTANESPLSPALNELANAIIQRKMIDDEDDDSINGAGDDVAGIDQLVDVLVELLEGPFQIAAFVEDDTVHWTGQIGLDPDHWVAIEFIDYLSTSKSFSSKENNQAGDVVYVHNQSGLSILVSESSVCWAPTYEQVLQIKSELPLNDKSRLSDNRRFARIQNRMADASQLKLYLDSGQLLERYGALCGSDIKKLLMDSGALDAIAVGMEVAFGDEKADWIIDAHVLCAVPRRGVWSIFEGKTFDPEAIDFVPNDSDFYVGLNINPIQLGEGLNQIKEIIRADKISEQEFMRQVVQLSPALYTLFLFKEDIADKFTGHICNFGMLEFTNAGGHYIWNTNQTLVFQMARNGTGQILEKIHGLVSPATPLEQSEFLGTNYWVQNRKAYERTLNHLKELEAQFPERFEGISSYELKRTAIAAIDDCISIFRSEDQCRSSISIHQHVDESLLHNDDWKRVKSFAVHRHKNLCGLGFFQSGSLFKWPYLQGIKKFAKGRVDMDHLPDTHPITRIFKKHTVSDVEAMQMLEAIVHPMGPVGIAISDNGDNIRLSIFQLHKK